jgi:hypothetical protein
MRPSQQLASHRRSATVNHWGHLGTWDFLPCRNPQQLTEEFRKLIAERGASQ